MNILIPHSWLLEHLETDAKPEEIQRLVSLSGPSIERIYDREGERVYDIEVTTNRVDSMSVRGIARECAVILNQAGVKASLKPLIIKQPLSSSSLNLAEGQVSRIPEVIDPNHLSKRTLFVVLQNVERTPTPEWMAKRLRQIEINVHDSVIDITNYITHELGHPCHAFDYDKIMDLGGKIIIKIAEPGKNFKTLDDAEYKTVGGEVVFENEAGEIIDFPGIKGTANSAISNQTKNVLFWIESIEPKKIRFGSMSHAIRTVAAQLNEKNVDPELALPVLEKGIELYTELCHATQASEIVDLYQEKKSISAVTIPQSTLNTYLGIELKKDVIVKILEDLGCRVEQNDDVYTVTPPTFRPDIQIPADVVEEVARIYGYHKLPSTLMDTPIPIIKPEGVDFHLEERIKHFLVDIGWQEIYSYSLVSEELAKQSGQPLDSHLKVANQLTDDRVYLRTSLIPSLNEAIDQSANRRTMEELSVFEIANIYQKQDSGLPAEIMKLCMVSSKPFRQVKGDLETLLANFHITLGELKTIDDPNPLITQSAQLHAQKDGQSVRFGTMYILSNNRSAVSVDILTFTALARKYPHYQPIPQTAQIVEDLTFTLPEKTLIGPILSTISTQSKLVYTVELKDMYKQNATFSITYLDPSKNLSSADIEPIRKSIVSALVGDYDATLVGNL